MDNLDSKILERLQENCRTSIADLAEQVGLSTSACHRRIKHLEEEGLIEGYVAQLNRVALGYSIEVFVEISLNSQSQEVLDSFERAVESAPEILECHLMAGPSDYLLRIAAADVSDYERIHRNQLSRLPAVARMQSNFAIRTVREWKGYPLRRR